MAWRSALRLLRPTRARGRPIWLKRILRRAAGGIANAEREARPDRRAEIKRHPGNLILPLGDVVGHDSTKARADRASGHSHCVGSRPLEAQSARQSHDLRVRGQSGCRTCDCDLLRRGWPKAGIDAVHLTWTAWSYDALAMNVVRISQAIAEQSRGGACTGIFSFQQMGRRWRSMQ